MDRPRAGVSVVELMIAVMIGTVGIVMAYNGLVTLRVSQSRTEEVSARTLEQIQLAEYLVQDLRSAIEVEVVESEKAYRVLRYVDTPAGLQERAVTWILSDSGDLIVRKDTVTGREKRFEFGELMSPEELPFKFRIEPVPGPDFFQEGP